MLTTCFEYINWEFEIEEIKCVFVHQGQFNLTCYVRKDIRIFMIRIIAYNICYQQEFI